MLLILSLLLATRLSWNMTMLLSSAMQQVIHHRTSSGPKMETVQFYIKEKHWLLKMLEDNSMDSYTNVQHGIMSLKMWKHLPNLLYIVSINELFGAGISVTLE